MFYWVIQQLGRNIHTIGPYKSSDAARNRMDKTSGGEVHLFRSLERDPKLVIQEFKMDKTGVGNES